MFVALFTVAPKLFLMRTWIGGEMAAFCVAFDGCTTNSSAAGVPGVALNAELVAEVRAPPDALSVYALAASLNVRLLNVATPAIALTVSVPPRVALPGLLPIAIEIAPVNDVTVLPFASCAATVTAGEMVAPATTVVGWPTTASFVALPAVAVAVMVSGDPPSPTRVVVIDCAPAPTPSVHVTRAEPDASVVALSTTIDPPPVATANVTTSPATPLPCTSPTFTAICARVEPATALCPPPADRLSAADAPAVTLNAELVVAVRPELAAASV
jgi:hypothetical protein